MAFPILETPSVHLPHLESKWLKSLRGYLASINAVLHLDATGFPPLGREHDGYIMEWIVHSNQFTDKEVVRLNYCRLFLNAVTLSDLTTTNGKYLDNGKLTGEISMMSTQSQWMSVQQDKPSDTEWGLWRKANKLWSMDNGTLRQPLGDWLHDLLKRRISHFAYRDKNNLLIRTQSGYMRCRLSHATTYRETGQKMPEAQIPLRAKPVEVIMSGPNEWVVIHTTNVRTLLMDLRQRPVATFDDFLSTLEAWEYDLLRPSTLFSDAFTISEDLWTSFVAGIDGSEKYGTDGAFGWMLSNAAGERASAGMGPSRGWQMDSYRAECSSILLLLRFLIRVGEYTFRVDSWCGTIGTDSQSMLEQLFGQSTVRSGEPLVATKLQELDAMVAEWDLLREIQALLQILPEVTLKYVKGHQDAHQVYTSLTLLAQLNVDADDKATAYQQQYGKAHPFVLMSPHAGAFVTIPEGSITAKVVKELREYATGPPLRLYIQQRNHWTDRIMTTINWNAHGKAFNGMIASRVHLTKLVHENLPTFQRLNKFTNGERKCPALATMRTKPGIIYYGALMPYAFGGGPHSWRSSTTFTKPKTLPRC